MKLQEIEERLSAIKSELETEGADITALSAETDKLLEERTVIKKEIETRKADLAQALAVKEEGEPIVKEQEVRTYGVESAEYRAAFLKQVRGLELSEVEQRAFTSAANSAGAAIPTQTANEILKKMKQYAPLLDEITLLQVAGNVTFAVENYIADATKHTENSSISASADTLTSITLGSYEVVKLVQVSKTVATMSIDAFESWLVDMLAQKVSAKITRYLISGTGSSEPTGIGSITYNTTNSVTVASTASLTDANVQSVIGLLPGSFDANAKWLMSKKTLFTDFMGLQNKAKNDIVINEGSKYFVYGYPVMIDEDIPLHDAYLGDLKNVVGNLSEVINIVSGFDINTNSYKYLGTAMFDSKIANAEAFVKLTKSTT
jgi:HK97 family phage major capsid protein